MVCRKRRLNLTYAPYIVSETMGDEIPCPACGVVHTPSGDRKINLKERVTDEQNMDRGTSRVRRLLH